MAQPTAGADAGGAAIDTSDADAMLAKLEALQKENYRVTGEQSEIKYNDKNIDKAKYGS